MGPAVGEDGVDDVAVAARVFAEAVADQQDLGRQPRQNSSTSPAPTILPSARRITAA
jgi:hypothetical protein